MRQLKLREGANITNRADPVLDKYLTDISGEVAKLITPEEEVALSKKIKEGDEGALNKLVQANLRFVITVAKQYQHQGLSLPELINEGNIGLVKAARRFDEMRGFKFISYAVWWIRQSILRALNDEGNLVRIPQNKIGNKNKIDKAYSVLEQKNGGITPTIEEISLYLRQKYPKANVIQDDEIEQALNGNRRPMSLDESFSQNDNDGSILEFFDTDQNERGDNIFAAIKKQELSKFVLEEMAKNLDRLEEKIICDYHGIGGQEPTYFLNIADRYNIVDDKGNPDPRKVKRIYEKGIKKLRKSALPILYKDERIGRDTNIPQWAIRGNKR